MTKYKPYLIMAAFAAAVFFFLCAVAGWDLGNLNEVAAGLLALAAGFLVERLP